MQRPSREQFEAAASVIQWAYDQRYARFERAQCDPDPNARLFEQMHGVRLAALVKAALEIGSHIEDGE
jgi:hypothetical protein